MSWLFAILLFLVIFMYFRLSKKYKYWINKGVPQTKPAILVGDSWKAIIRRKSYADVVQDIYRQAGGNRYIGMYEFLTPMLLVKDLELIKQMTVKDFDHFQDHRTILPESTEPLWNKNLLSLKGQRWKEMRATLSPSFTSSKMRTMFTLISECSQNFVKHFLEKADEDVKMLEMKDIFSRFTNDVIASVAFGVKCDSLANKNNEFYQMGKRATDLSGAWQNVKFILAIVVPYFSKIFGIKIFSKEVAHFFRTLIRDAIVLREQKNIIRPDMLQLLMEAKRTGVKYEDHENHLETGFAAVEESEIGRDSRLVKKELSEDDITAQALIFFFAGFDSVSSLMCFMAHELAVNCDIQRRLIEKIDQTMEQCNGQLTYEVLLKMEYMDMVVSETLRKWPSTIMVDRTVTKPYTIQPSTPDEVPIDLKKGDVLWIPIYSLHRDPELYPDPDKFDPERFSNENKDSIKAYSYVPFGVGPRNCIGSRFALLETKCLFFYLLSEFEVVVNERTQIPLKLSKKSFAMNAENGFWLSFRRRTKMKGEL